METRIKIEKEKGNGKLVKANYKIHYSFSI